MRAHIDDQNPAGEDTLTYAMPRGSSRGYVTKAGEFCPRENIDPDEVEIPFDGTLQPFKRHQCYTKCSLNAPCEGDDCHCDGNYAGYGALQSNAICGHATLCEYIGDQLDGCVSIDKHKILPRCFLNMESECDGNFNCMHDMHGADSSCDLLMKSMDPTDSNCGGRRAEATKDAKAEERSLSPTQDFGFSWESMFRFMPLQFESGGSFKLCFCDSSIRGSCLIGVTTLSPDHTPASLSSLTYEHAPVCNFQATRLLSKDRITILDCKGTCGVSSQTNAIVKLGRDEGKGVGSDIKKWNDFVPYSWLVAYAHIDDQNPAGEDTLTYAVPRGSSRGSVTTAGEFCPRESIDLDEGEIPFDGTLQPFKRHQC